MTVYIQCKGSRMMPKVFLYRFHIIAGLQRIDRVCMPQIMEAYML